MNILKLSLLGLVSAACVTNAQDNVWYFKETKVGGWSLSSDFVADLAKKFQSDVFIESGTSYGGSVKIAKSLFKQVFSVELDQALYNRARDLFAQDINVKLYQGDSGARFDEILPKVKNKKIMFWLDGHYSGQGLGARAEIQTPIVAELQSIKKHNIKDSIILIDDICCFKPDTETIPDIACGYPSVSELREMILDININYQIIIYGDIMIAYPSNYNISVSPLVNAMTISRFFTKDTMTYQDLFDAESVIAFQTSPEELEALWSLCTYHFNWHRTYPYLWYSLALFRANRHAEAFDNFKNVLETGYTDWRIYWYIVQAAYRSGKDFAPYAKELFRLHADTKLADAFLKRLVPA